MKANFDKQKYQSYLTTTLRGLAKFLSRRDSSERARFRPKAEERARIPSEDEPAGARQTFGDGTKQDQRAKSIYGQNKVGPDTAGPRDLKVLFQADKVGESPSHFGNAATILLTPDRSLKREAQTATQG